MKTKPRIDLNAASFSFIGTCLVACSSNSNTANGDAGSGAVFPQDGSAGGPLQDGGTLQTDSGTTRTFYGVGGTVSGLAGGGLVLYNTINNDVLPINAGQTAFSFPSDIPVGTGYNIQVQAQPTNPSQVCTVLNPNATATGDVTNLAVSCVQNAFVVGGTVTGLGAGLTLTLQDNGGDDQAVTANGIFSFATWVVSGQGYTATVSGQPTAQNCTVSAATGNASDQSVSAISVVCTTLTNCNAILAALPTAPTGLYTINPNGTAIPAYCDMDTFPSGWTLVYDQQLADTTPTSAGYLDGGPTSQWISQNVSSPNNGQYSILNLIGSVASAPPNFTFRLEWPTGLNVVDGGTITAGDAGVPASVVWSQTINPTLADGGGAAALVDGSVIETPPGQAGGGGFGGLSLSPGVISLLSGNTNTSPYGRWAVGAVQPSSGTDANSVSISGIAAFRPYVVTRTRLWIQ